MRAIHRVATGGTARHPSITEMLFVGTNPLGKRGGTSGNPVDAMCVATGAACNHPLLDKLSDETLIQLAAARGPVNGFDVKKLDKLGIGNELRAHVLIAKLNADRVVAESAEIEKRAWQETNPREAVIEWIKLNRPTSIGGSKGARRSANRAAYDALGFCPVTL